MRKLSLIALAIISSTAAQAEIIRIPQESGFSGYVMGGAGYTEYESNFFKGPDDNNKTHDGLYDSPASSDATHAIGGLDLRYTFAGSRTQIFLGNLIQDAIRYDFTQQLGVRQEIGDKGILGLSYVFNAKDAETWVDPYKTGKRKETDMSMDGMRLSWDQIWGSNFNAVYTYEELDLDQESSGRSLGLGADQMDLLDRNGELHRLSVSYDWAFAPDQVLRPELVYTQGDMDGEAASFDRYRVQVSYGYNGDRWSVTGNAFAGSTRYDEANPIFSDKADSDEYGIGGSFYWHRLVGVEGLSGVVSAAFMESDSDIEFYDANMSHVSTGLLFKF